MILRPLGRRPVNTDLTSFVDAALSAAGAVYVTVGHISESTGAQCRDVLTMRKHSERK